MRNLRNEHGFTLVELMWAMVLAVLLLGSVFSALQVGMRSSLLTSKTATFIDQGTSAIRTMQKYIRQASLINEARSDYLRISVEKPSGENVYDTYEYYIQGNKLYQKINGTPRVILENVCNTSLNKPLFRYYGEGESEITDPSLVRSFTRAIKITLFIDDNLNKEPPSIKIEETVYLRNFNL